MIDWPVKVAPNVELRTTHSIHNLKVYTPVRCDLIISHIAALDHRDTSVLFQDPHTQQAASHSRKHKSQKAPSHHGE